VVKNPFSISNHVKGVKALFRCNGLKLDLAYTLSKRTIYIEMMGHTISRYHDIQMKGVEFLRGIYIAAGLSIKPRTKMSKIDPLKEIIRAWGMNPEEILTRQALTEPHRTIIDRSQIEQSQLHQLSVALKQQMLKEIRESQGEKV
jgi:hypothetical protein